MRTALAIIIALVTACRSQPQTPDSVASDAGPPVHTEFFFGSPLAGPNQAFATGASSGQPWTAQVRVFPLGRLPQDAVPITNAMRMLVDPRRANPFLANPVALEDGGVLRGEAARRWLQGAKGSRTESLALLAGQSAHLRPWPDRSESCATLALHRPQGAATGLGLTILVESSGAPIEILQLSEPWMPGGEPWVLALKPKSGKAVAFALIPWDPPPQDPQWLAARDRGALEANAPKPTLLALPDRLQHQSRYLEAAMDRLREGPDRAVLMDLASELQAARAQDWILVCTDEELADLVSDLGKGNGRQGLAGHPSRFGLHLDTLALRQAAAKTTAATEDPGALAFLVRHTGQLAQYPDLLLEILDLAENLPDLTARFQAENRIFLEDTDRSARLRAFEWLKTFHLEPVGFDPLSRSSQRQAALERWRATLDQSPLQ